MHLSKVRRWVFGRPLKTIDAPHQSISKTVGLAVFASDSLSSVAYAGGEILLVLATIGAAHYWLAVPITVAICILLIILTLSYRQTIFAYPGGGGAYIVARDNLGEAPAQGAGAALLTDYVLTVSVSIASGVDQIASAFPVLFDYKVQLSLFLILVMALVNLRGVKESGRIFALPTYYFITMMLLMIGAGFWQAVNGTLGVVGEVPGAHLETVSLTGLALGLLILRAFSSGTTAVTGVEAISNGITAFKEPRSKNAATTLLWDAALLMVMFLGLGTLGYLIGAQASEQEVLISQVARVVFGDGTLRLLTLSSATVILIMAANTSFADFPRLAALHAGDGFLPKQFTFRGSRLVFSTGVIILAALASLLIFIFGGNVSRLIPLYAIGVFLSFTLSQAGMVKRWQKVGELMRTGQLTPSNEIATLGSILRYDHLWRPKQALNALGAVITAIVTLVFLVSKFTQGAWIIAILIPSLLLLFFRIHHHYRHVAQVLSTAGEHVSAGRFPIQTILLISDVHRETLRLVEYANSLGVPWTAIHVGVNEGRLESIHQKWQERVGMGELVILPSPYRSLSQPIRHYVKSLLAQAPNGYVQVLMGQLRTGSPMTQLLHQNSHFIEQLALQDLDHVVVAVVPIQLSALEQEEDEGDADDVRAELAEPPVRV
ncbi:MAG: APC family permease [Anaerolineae bacterium]|nr:APC family permease [Anaerolineae bacterium]